MRFALPVFLCCAAPLAAQMGPPAGFFSAEVQRYFELTPQQVAQLTQLAAAYDRMVAEKSQRLIVLQREIQEETARPVPDAVQVGGRYIEIEAIRREAEAAFDKLRQDAQALLTPAQKQKAQTLDEAQKMVGLALASQCYGLVNPVPPPPVQLGDGGVISRGGIVGPGILFPQLQRRGEIYYPNGSITSGCFFAPIRPLGESSSRP